MKISAAIRSMHPRRVFQISRARRTEVRNVFLRVEGEGITGWGEASPNAYYSENAEDVALRLRRLQPWLEGFFPRSVSDIAGAWDSFWPLLAPSRAAQCALDLALWDWLGKKEGVSVSELAWGVKPRPVPSFGTIGIMSPEERAGVLADYAGFSFIKLKMGAEPDEAVIAEVRKAGRARLSVDANAAWLGVPALDWASRLADAGAVFLEQPFPPSAVKQSAWLNREGALPVMADESCVVEEDVPGLEGSFSGCNIKLVKCGGLTPALRMLKKARSLGMKTMVGCMLESSLLISAGGVVAQGTDYADLDGAWLLRDDPFEGAPLVKGRMTLSGGPGLGVAGKLWDPATAGRLQ